MILVGGLLTNTSSKIMSFLFIKHYTPPFNLTLRCMESMDPITAFTNWISRLSMPLSPIGKSPKHYSPSNPSKPRAQTIYTHTFTKTLGPSGQISSHFLPSCFLYQSISDPLNDTVLCLIPKFKNANLLSNFFPIGLCNILYKVINKTIANRIKPFLQQVIGPYQSSFFKGRWASDNAILI